MEAFATVKQHRFFIGESPESSDANIELHYVFKIKKEHDRFNRAITTVAVAALDSDACLGLSYARATLDKQSCVITPTFVHHD